LAQWEGLDFENIALNEWPNKGLVRIASTLRVAATAQPEPWVCQGRINNHHAEPSQDIIDSGGKL
jgi:hypothetical protein